MERHYFLPEAGDDADRRSPEKLLTALCGIQVVAAVCAAAAAAFDVESIMGSCPAIALFGFLIALVSVRRRWADAMLFGLWCPIVTAAIALLISSFDWSPGTAATPVTLILAVNALVVAAGAAALVLRAGGVQSAQATSLSDAPVRFSIRGLLAVTTVLCILFAVMRHLGGVGDMLAFAIYGVGVLLLAVAILAWFRFREGRRFENGELERGEGVSVER